eukprot:TRINITY_DN4737_c0_g1_i1.p1 TRINITY_DN4737_c0_g1~~TRINITY_DN4737_c0_g1_i1.p1  ORF type:complete len:158 (+),score=36.96 TRINITY_DN4737_c0_g1_i1:42-515(+)
MGIGVKKYGGKGNTHRRFHGTKRTCDMDQTLTICNDNNCFVCRIIEGGFIIPKSAAHGSLYGRGVYFTSTSSKSHTYNLKSARLRNGVTARCMFVVNVVVGRGKLVNAFQGSSITSAGSDATGPFHSILGEVNGRDDECIVYTTDATCVTYLVIYDS